MMYVIWIIFLICFAKFNDQRLFYHMLAWLRGMVHGCSRFNAPFILYETNFLGIITYQWSPILKTLPSCSPVKAPNPNPRNKTPHQKRIKKKKRKKDQCDSRRMKIHTTVPEPEPWYWPSSLLKPTNLDHGMQICLLGLLALIKWTWSL